MNERKKRLPVEKANTLAEILRFGLEKKLPALRRSLNKEKIDPKKRDIFLRRWMRLYAPWPEWVLRVATEVLVVHFPRVQRKTIFEGLKAIHWLFFEAKIHDDSEPPQFDFPPDLRNELVRLFGHMEKHMEELGKQIEELKKELLKVKLPERSDEIEQKIKPKWQNDYKRMGDLFLDFLKRKPPEEHLPTMETLLIANKATFDEEGRARDTTATAIYRKILESWEEVELLSGPEQLCDFLDPVLGHGDAEAKLDRVKHIVRRMGIVFHPVCQGTR